MSCPCPSSRLVNDLRLQGQIYGRPRVFDKPMRSLSRVWGIVGRGVFTSNGAGHWKVTFCNEMYSICEALGIDYWEARELWLLDPRINKMHTAVVAQQNLIEETYKDVLKDWDGELEKLNGLEGLVKPLLDI